MWTWQDISQQARSVPDAVLHLLPDKSTVRYSSLEQHDGVHTASRLESGWSLARLRSKSQRSVYAAIGVLVVLTFVTFAAVSRQIIATDPSTTGDPEAIHELSASGDEHPISQLVRNAETQFQSRLKAQSTTLHEAIEEYKHRYGMPPPPLFDEWYRFATERKTELIDEFDPIYDSLKLFWAISPTTIRGRTREALGYDNTLMGVSIRGGIVRIVGSGQDDFQVSATKEMTSAFSQWVPDMDIAFNVNDEPRIVIPHEDVERLNSLATEAIQSVRPSKNRFTRPVDLNNGQSYDRVDETRFNQLGHQQTWSHARMSCPPDTPARSFDPYVKDADVYFSFSGINFVQNMTIFSDICLTPSVRDMIGLFNHPNVFGVSHDLIPIFSPSKLSSFHDILYPSPYYYADRTVYDQDSGVPWDEKTPHLYWRGATSGGYSEGGTWRTLLRQSILSKLASPGTVRLLYRETENLNEGSWTTKEIPGSDAAAQYDTKFTEVKQCAPAYCAEMPATLTFILMQPKKSPGNTAIFWTWMGMH